MAGQFPYSNASGEVILKGILQKLDLTISQLERETGLSYSSLQRIFNGETKKITIPVYEGIKARYPQISDKYLKDAIPPIITDEEEPAEQDDGPRNDVDIIGILESARHILASAEEKEKNLRLWETRLIERSHSLDLRAQDLDAYSQRLSQIAIQRTCPEG